MIDRPRVARFEVLRAVVVRVGRGEAGRVAAEAVREFMPQGLAHGVARRGVVFLGEEEVNARPPAVVGRHLVVEAEHLGAGAESRGAVAQARELRVEDGLDRLDEKEPAQLDALDEIRHARLSFSPVVSEVSGKFLDGLMR
jgi:hypothetical protein